MTFSQGTFMGNVVEWGLFWGMVGACVYLALLFSKRIGAAGAAVFAWTLISALRTFYYPQGIFPGLTLHFDHTSGKAFAMTLMLVTAVILTPYKWFRHWRRLVSAFVIVDLCLLLKYGFGLMNANSHDGGWIASMLAVTPLWLTGVAILVLLKTRGATAMMVLMAHYLVWVSTLKGNARGWGVMGFIPVVAAAWMSQGKKLINSSGRFEAWKRAIDFWYDNHMMWTGTGIGTWKWIDARLQCGPELFVQPCDKPLFFELHNDWLQPLIEGGIVLFVLLLLFFGSLVWRSRGRPRVMASLLGIGVLCLSYHPLRFFFSALWVMILCREIAEPTVYQRVRLSSAQNASKWKAA